MKRILNPRGGAQRGAVLVETAIVAAALLAFMLGIVELGITGFEQLTIDAAGFLNAHQRVIGVKDAAGPNDATSQVFPNVKPSSYISATVQVAPSPDVPVDYGYNGTASEQQNASTNHVGGASLVQPYILQTSLQQNLFSLLGHAVDARSVASEPEYLESDLNYGVSNLNYGNGSTSSGYRSNLFTNGELTAPQYFAVWANYQACNDAPAVQSSTCNGNAEPANLAAANGLPASGTREDAAAMGVYLDVNNWSRQGLGISGPVCTSGSCSSTGAFEAAACHQRFFSAIASFIAANNDLNKIENKYQPMVWNSVAYNNVQYFGQSGSFETAGTINGTTTPAMPYNFASNIQTIYGWDLKSLNNYTGVAQGVNGLKPMQGCT